ncbi:MAG: hypothetical protein JXB19_04550 [Bacteroidales bacterium]|nr:hypothetical protein [Bacteroidales bacterium]
MNKSLDMDTVNNQDKQKEKRRAIPFFWWFGGAVAGGGLIALAILLAGKNNQVNDLELKLSETETAYKRERDSLSNEIRTFQFNNDTLMLRNEILGTDLQSALERNARLSALNASNNQQIMKFKSENAELQTIIDKYLSENETLSTRVDTLNSQIEDLQVRLQEINTTNTMLAEKIGDQNERIVADSAAMAEAERLRKEEDVSGYFNNTDIGAAPGLKIISVPYTHHFYSINMINGYVINRRFATGIGVGLNAYNGGMAAPVYLDFRYNLKETGFIPYFFADGGLLFVFENLKEPGLFINPGAGIYRNVSDRLAVNLGAGLFVQRTPIQASFVNFKLGLIFFGRKGEQ